MNATKVCRSCGKELPLTLDYFYKSGNGFQTACRKCMANHKKEWAAKNPDKVNAYSRMRRSMWSEEQHETAKEYYRQYYIKHKEEQNAKARERYRNNKDKVNQYKELHRDERNAHKREYERRKRSEDQMYFLKQRVRSVIYKAFSRRGYQKISLAEEITGMSCSDLCEYLTATYEKTYGVPWNGKEKVHIDHIVPLALASSEDDVKNLNHYSNLRLIKAKDNLLKGSKLHYSIGDNAND